MLQLILWYWTFEMHLELLSSRALQTFALLILYSLPKSIVKSSSDSDRSWNMVTSSFRQKVFSVDHCCHLLSTASNYNSSAVTANNVRLDQCANCATASPYLQIFQVSRAELWFSNETRLLTQWKLTHIRIASGYKVLRRSLCRSYTTLSFWSQRRTDGEMSTCRCVQHT